MVLEAVRSVANGVRSLIAAIRSEPTAAPAEELQRGLLDIDSLLEDWIVAAEATTLLVEKALDPLDSLDDEERTIMYSVTLPSVAISQQAAAHPLLDFVQLGHGNEHSPNPYERRALHQVGASLERSTRVMRLFEIYGEGTVEAFRDLVKTRKRVLTSLFTDIQENFRFAPERRQEMRDSYVDLLRARSELRAFFRETFPIAPIPPPRPYNVHVSGGVVGNIGDYGATEVWGPDI